MSRADSPAGWTECGLCGEPVKGENLEGHVRGTHPSDYGDIYPGAAGRGLAPCGVCGEWFSVRDTVATRRIGLSRQTLEMTAPEHQAHVAEEHPAEFGAEYPSECLLCTLGFVEPEWPPLEGDASDFVWNDAGDDIRDGAAAAHVGGEIGWTPPEALVREHWEHEGSGLEVAASDDPAARAAFELGRLENAPTDIEREVFSEAEEGERYTVAELAELIGRTERGVRERIGDLVGMGILEPEGDGRPRRYRATGRHGYVDMGGRVRDLPGDEDPAEVPDDEAGRYGDADPVW